MLIRELITDSKPKPLLNEAVAVPLLLSLIADITGFRAWVDSKVQAAVKGLLPAAEQNTLKQIDQTVAEELGPEDNSIGSVVSMLVWNVVLGGTPLNAAILTVRELVGKQVQQGVQTAVTDYLINRHMRTLAQAEPWADRAEDTILNAPAQNNSSS